MKKIEIECINCRDKIDEQYKSNKVDMPFSDRCMDWSKIAKLIKRREDFL